MAGGGNGMQDGPGSGSERHGYEGTLIAGRYRLTERLGAGGMGRVWRAHDESLDCDVALKEVWLPPMLSDAERADRLARAQREAKNAARLRNHPHIVSIHDMISDDGLPWIVMDLIPSQNLSQVIAEHGPLPLDQVATLGLGVLEALTASHAAGILHRDVKPANVLLTHDGRVLLTDFGIAVQESDLTMTSSGVLVGSPEYVAPERARGESSKAASDLFSLGATLYYAAEGKSPFARETAVGVLTAILFEDAAAVVRQPRLATLITGLLNKDPERRVDAPRARAELIRLGGKPSLGAGVGGSPVPVTEAVSITDTVPDVAPALTLPMPPQPSADPSYQQPANPNPFGPAQPMPQPFAAAQAPPPPFGPSQPMAQPLGTNPAWQQNPPMPPNPPLPFGPQVGAVPPKKGNNGKAIAITLVSLLAVGGIAAAIALSGGNKPDTVANVNTTATITSSPAPATSSFPSTDQSTTTDQPTDTPTTDDTSSDSFDPTQLDESSTDTTPMTADALLPQTFTDSKGVVYDQKSSGEENCVNSYETTAVQNVLNAKHCVNAVVGTYVDTSSQVLVAVQIMALDTSSDAVSAYNSLSGDKSHSNDWGIWCPQDGPGSQICDNKEDISSATQTGYIEQDHRYLIHTLALYINLSQDTSVKPYTQAAAQEAADSAGPQNYIGNE